MERARGQIEMRELSRTCAIVFAVVFSFMVVIGFLIQSQKSDAEYRRALMAATDSSTKKIVEHESFMDAMLNVKGFEPGQ